MRSTFAAMMVLALAAVSVAPNAAFADDRHHYSSSRHYSYDHDRRRGNGDAVAAGVFGLALGAILGAAASDSHRRHRCDYGCNYSNEGYYDRDGYYGGDGYYARPPALCITREQRWDPYSGREILIEDRRPC